MRNFSFRRTRDVYKRQLYKNSNTSDKDVFRFTGKAIWNIDKHLKLQGTIGTDINSMNLSLIHI